MTDRSGLPPANLWWWPLGREDGQRPVLFFPPSGTEPSGARALLAHAGGLRFGVAQLPGRGSRHDERPPADLPALIAEMAAGVKALDGPPPVLVGHSFGGLLAYGVAAELDDLGVQVARLVVVASASPRAWQQELAADRERHPGESRAAFVARRSDRILAGAGVAPELLAHPEFAVRARELVEVDVGLSHQGFDVRQVRTPITSVVARADTVLSAHAPSAWAEISTGPFHRIDVPGDHFFYRKDPQRLMTQVRMEIQSLDLDYELL